VLSAGHALSMCVGMKLLSREVLEARPRRSEHCQGGGRRLHYLDSAQRAIQSGGASRKPTGKGRECAPESRFRRAMWPRETTARSGDIEGGIGSPPAKPMSSGFTAESTVVCAAAKNTKSLAARVSGYGTGGQPIPRANAVWNIAGMVTLGDVAACDVQAATSPANRIAHFRTKSWRFAGGVLGGGGENTTRQRPSFWMAFRVGNWRSANFRRCGREKPRLAAATSLAASGRHRPSQCLRVLQRSTAVCAVAKNTKSLAARAGGCGAGGQPIPSANAMWHTNGQMLMSDPRAGVEREQRCAVRSVVGQRGCAAGPAAQQAGCGTPLPAPKIEKRPPFFQLLLALGTG